MPEYLVRDKAHQCCELTAASVAVDKETGDLVFYAEDLTEVCRVAAGWAGYALKSAVESYSVEVFNG